MSVKKGLGKGLSALIGQDPEENIENNAILEVDIHKIEPNKDQPRKDFGEEALNELAQSIREFGIIQPLIVKKINDYFEIIAGERRYRAARIAKLKKVPVIIKDYDELERLQVSLVENIQRENLNPIEEAFTYKKLAEAFSLSQEEIAAKVGKNRATVANSIRLLNLDKRVQNFLYENKLTTGHARALLAIEDFDKQFELAEKTMEEQLSVRQVEELVKRENENSSKEKTQPKDKIKLPIYKNVEEDLVKILGTKVQIKSKNDKGKIEIEYYSEEDLDRLFILMKRIVG